MLIIQLTLVVAQQCSEYQFDIPFFPGVSCDSSNEANHLVVNQSFIDACLWNARSLVNKLQDFSSFVLALNYQIIAITETWLTSLIYDNEILPFSIYYLS